MVSAQFIFNFTFILITNSLKVMGGMNMMNQSKVGSSMSKSRVGGGANRSVMVGGASRTTLSSSRRSQIGIDTKAENKLGGGRVHHAIQVKACFLNQIKHL